MKNIRFFYPGWTRKALTFTIDDGNLAMDERFISIVKPHGIRGTFNLCSHSHGKDSGFFRELYSGFEIANHCKFHPFAMDDAIVYELLPLSKGEEAVPSQSRLYGPDNDGLYQVLTERGWRRVADNETYVRLCDETRAELEDVFGKGSVGSFVWPYREQNNAFIKAHLAKSGYYAIRKTGCVLDSTDFALPADLSAWSYNADNRNLLSVASLYDACEDNGELRFFAFGVHSWDFERDGNWDELEQFCMLYGDRPGDFWYSTTGEIFAYVNAVKDVSVTEAYIRNGSDLTVYLEIDGKREEIPPKTEIVI